MITFSVAGKPATKGSYRAIPAKGRVVVVNDNPRCKAWQTAVGWKAKIAMAGRAPLAGPVSLSAVFRFDRPRTSKLPAPAQDTDKLLRALFDALTGIAYLDDRQVVRVAAAKQWGEAGVAVTIEPMTQETP